jgi:hypothetical protein
MYSLERALSLSHIHVPRAVNIWTTHSFFTSTLAEPALLVQPEDGEKYMAGARKE